LVLNQSSTQQGGKFGDFPATPISLKDDIAPMKLRKDELTMHWFDSLAELVLHRFTAAAAIGYVSRQAASQSQLHWSIEEYAEAEVLANASRP